MSNRSGAGSTQMWAWTCPSGPPRTDTVRGLPSGMSSAGARSTAAGPNATWKLVATGSAADDSTTTQSPWPHATDPPPVGTSGSCTTSGATNEPSSPTVTAVAGPHRAATASGVGSSRTSRPHWASDHAPGSTSAPVTEMVCPSTRPRSGVPANEGTNLSGS